MSTVPLPQRLREASQTLAWAGVGLTVSRAKAQEALVVFSEALESHPDFRERGRPTAATLRNLSRGLLPGQKACASASQMMREMSRAVTDRDAQPQTLSMVLRGM